MVCETRGGSLESWGVPRGAARPVPTRGVLPWARLVGGTSGGPVARAHPAGSACGLELIRWHLSNCCSSGSRSRLLGEQEFSVRAAFEQVSGLCCWDSCLAELVAEEVCPVALSALEWPEIASRIRQLGAFFVCFKSIDR